MNTHHVFVAGGTGYIGRPLIRELLARGHSVRALVRPGSAGKLPAGAVEVKGDALNATSFEEGILLDCLLEFSDNRPSVGQDL